MNYVHYNAEQYLFDRILRGIFTALQFLFKGVIYFPMLFTGYVLATKLLDKQDNGITWVAVIVLLAIILYFIVFMLKGMLIAFKSRNNLLWVPLFLLYISYTCVAPLWIAFETLQKWMFHLSKENGASLTWLCCFAVGYYLYSRYHFLSDFAPVFAMPFYRAGFNLAKRL